MGLGKLKKQALGLRGRGIWVMRHKMLVLGLWEVRIWDYGDVGMRGGGSCRDDGRKSQRKA